MATFVKAQASSFIASLIDFLTTIVCKEVFLIWYVTASFIGTVAGGFTNFALGRAWVFRKRKEKTIPLQAFKYLLVWCGNLALNTLGVFLVTHYIKLDYKISKIVVSFTVGITYNYFLQKKFVFA
ncbi:MULTISPECIES: GtrA family protein [unclassified Mucilaginibacter]|uniref:GtrA family protein n=1 Tax=unclassified Mucilaginibacter TaxID=2617802 RepID=UPI002AC904B7|nr:MULTISPECIES: GtrA family protein [unclassified Mucilaginibacter]MEB0260138.1 GtrA family protein [Mucilaginibacter sp. 10I4]MEB0279141.1 GtrA family protein [Mucilaginibacter sp. 10B2]MEB0302919.1 GtrA family protein [Mucilaginibacter sp. 5C4]WPX22319.1 GtrA family protein [Mucilaginibacter sp. 5C4]